jgi:hypothetical protein
MTSLTDAGTGTMEFDNVQLIAGLTKGHVLSDDGSQLTMAIRVWCGFADVSSVSLPRGAVRGARSYWHHHYMYTCAPVNLSVAGGALPQSVADRSLVYLP